jgi:hypothetical protein
MVGWEWTLPVLFALVGTAIIARQPRNLVGWLLMLPALVEAATVVASDATHPATPPAVLTTGLLLRLWFDNWSWIPLIFPVLLIPLNFPTGRPPSSRWNWVNWLAVGMWLFFLIVHLFSESIGPIGETWKVPNPIGFIPLSFSRPFLPIWAIGLAVLTLSSVISLVVRYRRAQRVERQQIKWLLYGGSLFALGYVPSTFVILTSNDPTSGTINSWVGLLLVSSILTFPVAIAIAILRYRLYDIDVIIRKTMQYGVVTAVLALIYFGTIILLQSLIGRATGEQSPIIIVLSTLLIATLFNPLRNRIQETIDRRFYRRKYDAQQVLAQFAQTARDEVEMAALQAELLQVVQETLQPETVSIWIKQ